MSNKEKLNPLTKEDIEFLENGPRPIIMNTVVGFYLVCMFFFWFAPNWFRELMIIQGFINSMSFAESVQITRDWVKQGVPIENGALMMAFTVFYLIVVMPISVFLVNYQYGFTSFLKSYSAPISVIKGKSIFIFLSIIIAVYLYIGFGYDTFDNRYDKQSVFSSNKKAFSRHLLILFYGTCFVTSFGYCIDMLIRVFFHIIGKHNLIENDKIIYRFNMAKSKRKTTLE